MPTLDGCEPVHFRREAVDDRDEVRDDVAAGVVVDLLHLVDDLRPLALIDRPDGLARRARCSEGSSKWHSL